MVAYSLLPLYIGNAHNYKGRKEWPMTFIYLKEKSVHPHFMPERDSLDSRLDLKCYFQERRKLLQGDVLLSEPGLIASQHKNIWCYFSHCRKSYLVSSHQARLGLPQSLCFTCWLQKDGLHMVGHFKCHNGPSLIRQQTHVH